MTKNNLQFLDLTELTNFQGKELLKEFTCDICEKSFSKKDIEKENYRFILSPHHTNKLTKLKENVYDLNLRVISVDHELCTQKVEREENKKKLEIKNSNGKRINLRA